MDKKEMEERMLRERETLGRQIMQRIKANDFGCGTPMEMADDRKRKNASH